MRDSPDRRESPDDFIRLPEVVRMTGLSKAEIYRRILAGTFPEQIKLGPRISAWQRQRIICWKRRFDLLGDLR